MSTEIIVSVISLLGDAGKQIADTASIQETTRSFTPGHSSEKSTQNGRAVQVREPSWGAWEAF